MFHESTFQLYKFHLNVTFLFISFINKNILETCYSSSARSTRSTRSARSARSLLGALAAVVTMLADLPSVPGLAYESVTGSLAAFAHSSSASSTPGAARSVRPTLRSALAYLVSFLSQNALGFSCYAGIDAAFHRRSG